MSKTTSSVAKKKPSRAKRFSWSIRRTPRKVTPPSNVGGCGSCGY